MEPIYYYRAVTERVIDGDTYQLRVDLGFRVAVSINGRLRGVNCPEKNTDAGKRAAEFARLILLPDKKPPTELVIQSYKDEQSFARWVVVIWIPGNVSLAQQIIKFGHGEVLLVD